MEMEMEITELVMVMLSKDDRSLSRKTGVLTGCRILV